jgi:hypothetical protein
VREKKNLTRLNRIIAGFKLIRILYIGDFSHQILRVVESALRRANEHGW